MAAVLANLVYAVLLVLSLPFALLCRRCHVRLNFFYACFPEIPPVLLFLAYLLCCAGMFPIRFSRSFSTGLFGIFPAGHHAIRETDMRVKGTRGLVAKTAPPAVQEIDKKRNKAIRKESDQKEVQGVQGNPSADNDIPPDPYRACPLDLSTTIVVTGPGKSLHQEHGQGP